MNYRHAYHAGNFADVMKHVFLVRVLVHLRRKHSAFRAIDTHAGIGAYDLSGEEAGRTQEWRGGVGRLEATFSLELEELIAPYRAVVAHDDGYPGSPAIIRAFLRPQDRAIFSELHPADAVALRRRFARDKLAKVVHLDGWTALHAFIPPKERRGLVLTDPSYEEPGEIERLAIEMAKAFRKWPTGIFIGWYPIKDPGEVERPASVLGEAAGGKGLRLEVLVDAPDVPDRLNGCGLFVLNPPWTLREEAEAILPALAERLSRSGYGAFRCEALASA
jgi:23S rRNA (adenine2030-N6)-methyltransferase